MTIHIITSTKNCFGFVGFSFGNPLTMKQLVSLFNRTTFPQFWWSVFFFYFLLEIKAWVRSLSWDKSCCLQYIRCSWTYSFCTLSSGYNSPATFADYLCELALLVGYKISVVLFFPKYFVRDKKLYVLKTKNCFWKICSFLIQK